MGGNDRQSKSNASRREEREVSAMTKKVYYIENTPELDEAVAQITDKFPCFLNRETIEMNYSIVEIVARNEDIASIENILAPLV